MWFKNLRLLKFEDPISYQPEKLANQLKPLLFKPCPKSLPFSYGFVPPLGDENASLVLAQNPFMLVRLRIEEKVLPPAVVRDKLKQEIQSIEQKTGRRVYKDEKERIKDEVYQTLLTQAFTKSTYVDAYIDTKKNWLIVDCANNKKFANFMSLLNKCLDNHAYSFEHESAVKVMTRWLLKSNHPSTFAFANACFLKDPDENGCTARIKNVDLFNDKVQSFLKEGLQVTQLAVEWSEQIRFNLKEDFSLGSVRFLESVKELARDGLTENKEDRFAADFLLMGQTLQQFYADFLPNFSKQEQPEFVAIEA